MQPTQLLVTRAIGQRSTAPGGSSGGAAAVVLFSSLEELHYPEDTGWTWELTQLTVIRTSYSSFARNNLIVLLPC